MAKTNRDLNKLKSLISKTVKDIVQNEITNENIGFMTITDVEVSSDHSYCKIFVSFINNKKNSLEILNRAKGYVRSSLAKKINLRRVPEISFVLDDSFDRQERLEKLLKKEDEDISSLKEKEHLD